MVVLTFPLPKRHRRYASSRLVADRFASEGILKCAVASFLDGCLAADALMPSQFESSCGFINTT